MAPVRTQLLDLSQAPSHAQNPGSPVAHAPAAPAHPPAHPSAPPAYSQPNAPAWPSPHAAPPAAPAPHHASPRQGSPQQGWPSPSGAPQPWPASRAAQSWPSPNAPAPVWPAAAPAWPHPGAQGAPTPTPPVDPSTPSSDDRTTATIAYVGALFMPVFVPLLIFATSDKKPFVRAVAAQALASQIGATALGMLLPLLSVVAVMVLSQSKEPQGLIGVVAMWPFMSMLLVLALGTYAVIRGAMCAHRGEVWRVPLIGGLVARLTGTNA